MSRRPASASHARAKRAFGHSATKGSGSIAEAKCHKAHLLSENATARQAHWISILDATGVMSLLRNLRVAYKEDVAERVNGKELLDLCIRETLALGPDGRTPSERGPLIFEIMIPSGLERKRVVMAVLMGDDIPDSLTPDGAYIDIVQPNAHMSSNDIDEFKRDFQHIRARPKSAHGHRPDRQASPKQRSSSPQRRKRQLADTRFERLGFDLKIIEEAIAQSIMPVYSGGHAERFAPRVFQLLVDSESGVIKPTSLLRGLEDMGVVANRTERDALLRQWSDENNDFVTFDEFCDNFLTKNGFGGRDVGGHGNAPRWFAKYLKELDADVVQYLVSELNGKRRYDMVFVKHDPYNTGILDFLAFRSAFQELGLKLHEHELTNIAKTFRDKTKSFDGVDYLLFKDFITEAIKHRRVLGQGSGVNRPTSTPALRPIPVSPRHNSPVGVPPHNSTSLLIHDQPSILPPQLMYQNPPNVINNNMFKSQYNNNVNNNNIFSNNNKNNTTTININRFSIIARQTSSSKFSGSSMLVLLGTGTYLQQGYTCLNSLSMIQQRGLEKALDEIQEQASEKRQDDGLNLTVVPRMCGMTFSPARAEVALRTPLLRMPFRGERNILNGCAGCELCELDDMINSTTPTQLNNNEDSNLNQNLIRTCVVDVWSGIVLVASLKVKMFVYAPIGKRTLGVSEVPLPEPCHAHAFQKVMVLSSNEADVVTAIYDAKTQLTHPFLNIAVTSLLDNGHRSIAQDNMDSADNVQVCWSKEAKDSAEVAWAIRVLAQRANTNVVLVYWQHPRPPLDSFLQQQLDKHMLRIVFYNHWLLYSNALPRWVQTTSEAGTNKQNKPGTMFTVLRKGDRVFARYRGRKKYDVAVVSAVNKDGTYDVAFDDGHAELGILKRFIRRAEGRALTMGQHETQSENDQIQRAVAQHTWGARVEITSSNSESKTGKTWGRIAGFDPLSDTYEVLFQDGERMKLKPSQLTGEGVGVGSKKDTNVRVDGRAGGRTYSDAIADHLRTLIRHAAASDDDGGNMRTQFDKMDLSGDGRISFRDFALSCMTLGFGATEAEMHELMDHIDRDKNGSITYSEFVRFAMPQGLDEGIRQQSAMEAAARGTKSEQIQHTMRSALGDLRERLLAYTQKYTLGTVWETFGRFDMQKRGKLSYDDFSLALKACGIRLLPGETHQLLRCLDYDDNGVVAYREFVAFLENENTNKIMDGDMNSGKSKNEMGVRNRELEDELEAYRERDKRLNMEHRNAKKVQAVVRGRFARKRFAVQRYQASHSHSFPNGPSRPTAPRKWVVSKSANKRVKSQQNSGIVDILNTVQGILKQNCHHGSSVPALMRYLDKDMDGRIGEKDLLNSLKDFGLDMSIYDVKRLIFCFDIEGNGALKLSELNALINGGASKINQEKEREEDFKIVVENLGITVFEKLFEWAQTIIYQDVNPTDICHKLRALDNSHNGAVRRDDLLELLNRLGFSLSKREMHLVGATFATKSSDQWCDYRKFLRIVVCRNYGYLVQKLPVDVMRNPGGSVSLNGELDGDEVEGGLGRSLRHIAILASELGKQNGRIRAPTDRARLYLEKVLGSVYKQLPASEFQRLLNTHILGLKISSESLDEVCAYFPIAADYSGANVDVEAFKHAVATLAGELGANSVVALRQDKKYGRNDYSPRADVDSSLSQNSETTNRHKGIKTNSNIEQTASHKAFRTLGSRLVRELRDNDSNTSGKRGKKTYGAKFKQIGECLRDYHASNFGVIDSLEIDLLLRGVGIELVNKELETLCSGLKVSTNGKKTNASSECMLDARRFANLIGLNYNTWVPEAQSQSATSIRNVHDMPWGDNMEMIKSRQHGFHTFYADMRMSIGPTVADKIQQRVSEVLRSVSSFHASSRQWLIQRSMKSKRKEPRGRNSDGNADGTASSILLSKSLAEAGLWLTDGEMAKFIQALGPDSRGHVAISNVATWLRVCELVDRGAMKYAQHVQGRRKFDMFGRKLKSVLRLSEHGARASLIRKFKALDTAACGKIKVEELVAVLQGLQVEIKENDATLISETFDKEKDGKVKYALFLDTIDSIPEDGGWLAADALFSGSNAIQRASQSNPVLKQLQQQLQDIPPNAFFAWLSVLGTKSRQRIKPDEMARLLTDLDVALSIKEVGVFLKHAQAHGHAETKETGRENSSSKPVGVDATRGEVERLMLDVYSASKQEYDSSELQERMRANLDESELETKQESPRKNMAHYVGRRASRSQVYISGFIRPNTLVEELTGRNRGRVGKYNNSNGTYKLVLENGKTNQKINRGQFKVTESARPRFSLGVRVLVDVPAANKQLGLPVGDAKILRGRIVREIRSGKNNKAQFEVALVSETSSSRSGPPTSSVQMKVPVAFLELDIEFDALYMYGTEVEVCGAVVGENEDVFYPATVRAVRATGRYDVEFEFGERASNVSRKDMRSPAGVQLPH